MIASAMQGTAALRAGHVQRVLPELISQAEALNNAVFACRVNTAQQPGRPRRMPAVPALRIRPPTVAAIRLLVAGVTQATTQQELPAQAARLAVQALTRPTLALRHAACAPAAPTRIAQRKRLQKRVVSARQIRGRCLAAVRFPCACVTVDTTHQQRAQQAFAHRACKGNIRP